jgi:hypothetical protein
MTGHGHTPRFRGVLELLVTSTGGHETPPVVLKHFDHVSDLHVASEALASCGPLMPGKVRELSRLYA